MNICLGITIECLQYKFLSGSWIYKLCKISWLYHFIFLFIFCFRFPSTIRLLAFVLVHEAYYPNSKWLQKVHGPFFQSSGCKFHFRFDGPKPTLPYPTLPLKLCGHPNLVVYFILIMYFLFIVYIDISCTLYLYYKYKYTIFYL